MDAETYAAAKKYVAKNTPRTKGNQIRMATLKISGFEVTVLYAYNNKGKLFFEPCGCKRLKADAWNHCIDSFRMESSEGKAVMKKLAKIISAE